MQIEKELTLADLDEALSYLREKIQDRYGNRLRANERQVYLDSIDDLLDARNALTLK
jgi:hypothetical protein